MDIKHAGSQPSAQGPSACFTGSVRIDPLFKMPEPASCVGVSVTFEPGSRTVWHTHPLGQTLIITSGCGWTQYEGESIAIIRPGDVIQCPPVTRHWHGATSTTGMTHIAITPKLNDKAVD